MYQVQGIVRDYDPSTDTATVELTGIGAVEAWISGVKPADSVNRAFLSYGYLCIVHMPDVHRICDATIVQVFPSGTVVSTAATVTQKTQTGRSSISSGAAGSGSVSITFPVPFSATPNVSVSMDRAYPTSISAVTTTGCTVSVTGGPVNGLVFFSWSATGNA